MQAPKAVYLKGADARTAELDLVAAETYRKWAESSTTAYYKAISGYFKAISGVNGAKACL